MAFAGSDFDDDAANACTFDDDDIGKVWGGGGAAPEAAVTIALSAPEAAAESFPYIESFSSPELLSAPEAAAALAIFSWTLFVVSSTFGLYDTGMLAGSGSGLTIATSVTSRNKDRARQVSTADICRPGCHHTLRSLGWIW